MPDMWNDLLSCLDLEPVLGIDNIALQGGNQALPYHRVFGGQILGQLLTAARLARPDKVVKSLHTVFTREGRSDTPIRYYVSVEHEGRSFATLSMLAYQGERVIASAIASLHVPEEGPHRQSLPAVGPVLGPEHRVEFPLLPWEVRASDDLDSIAVGAPEYTMWMRTPPVEPELGRALTAYATDLTLIGTALRPEAGISHTGNGTRFLSAVTTHTLWFHGAVRSDTWQMLRQHSPILSGGRIFGRGDVLTEDGLLVASYAQEAMFRMQP
ncbi:acyl-CoA thioesterase domain-containing protein [Nocardia sp. NPDC050378]|uniref:acyl-CoA thioesterase n=1 Tax=Nocardia sp. NPDC050378 TaxID=3155400 RepID=UPI0033E8D136